MPQNLKEDYRQLKRYLDLTELPDGNKFDLIIIDGKDHNLRTVMDLISKNGILAIEEDCIMQQDSLQELFPRHKYVHCVSREKNKSYSPFPEAHWWIWERVSTKLKYWFLR